MIIYFSGQGMVDQPQCAPEGVLANPNVMLSYEFIRRSRSEGKNKGQSARLRRIVKARKRGQSGR